MKKLLVCVLTMMMIGLFMGCDDTETATTSDNSTPNNEFNKTMSLQGTVFDATTGARLTGPSLTVTLTQGSNYYTPNVLKKAATDTVFGGDYAFVGIPITVNASVTYRITVTFDGYQRFEGYYTPDATNPDDDLDDDDGNNNTIDTVYNDIGNIYMYPLGATATDVEVYVEYNDERCIGATVTLQPDTNSNNGVTEENNTITASTGQLNVLTATTDNTGRALFNGADLVLGGSYHYTVLPFKHDGVQLGQSATTTIVVGTASIVRFVAMADLVPGDAVEDGLYIVSISNQDADDIRSNGWLDIVFSRPVKLVMPNNITGVLANQGSGALFGGADAVVEELSADGLRLTLKPGFQTRIPSTATNSTITYGNVRVTLLNDNGDDFINVFTELALLDESAVNGVVNLNDDES